MGAAPHAPLTTVQQQLITDGYPWLRKVAWRFVKSYSVLPYGDVLGELHAAAVAAAADQEGASPDARTWRGHTFNRARSRISREAARRCTGHPSAWQKGNEGKFPRLSYGTCGYGVKVKGGQRGHKSITLRHPIALCATGTTEAHVFVSQLLALCHPKDAFVLLAKHGYGLGPCLVKPYTGVSAERNRFRCQRAEATIKRALRRDP